LEPLGMGDHFAVIKAHDELFERNHDVVKEKLEKYKSYKSYYLSYPKAG
jgi:hypothetical protein